MQDAPFIPSPRPGRASETLSRDSKSLLISRCLQEPQQANGAASCLVAMVGKQMNSDHCPELQAARGPYMPPSC